ncbi:MAG: NAD(P)H-dependent oxidoreductase [Candidatus Kapaibacterium sp.]
MTNPIHVVGISGSLRKGSYNTALLHAARELMPDGMTMEIADFSGLPIFNADEDQPPPSSAQAPAIVQAFRDTLRAADALVIASPEYNYSIPGGLKNAIDWASRPPRDSSLNGKPLAIMGATTSLLGTARMQYHLRQVCVFTNMFPLNKPEVFVAKAQEKFDAEGKLIDEMARTLIRSQLEALLAWTLQLKKV